MNVSMRVEDAAARAQMRKYPDKFDRALRGFLNDVSAFYLREAEDYPEQRPTDYIRTNTLARAWNRSPVQGSMERMWVIVGNDGNIAPYNIWVQDEEHQASVHVGNWRTLQGIIRDSSDRANNMFEARVRAEL